MNDTNDKTGELIMSFLEHRMSDEQYTELSEWISSDPDNKELLSLIEEIDSHRSTTIFDVEGSYNRLLMKLSERKKLKRYRLFSLLSGIAACLALVVTLGLYLSGNRGNDDERFVYNSGTSMSQVQLPDGTQITLAPYTELSYNLSFGHENRDVKLSGEGYFVVAKNEKLPFRVQSADQQITVTGTRFNVYAYDDDDNIITTLVEGKISFASESLGKTIDMSPNEQVKYNKVKKELSIERVREVWKEVSWTEGLIHFEPATLGEILRRMKNVYGVTFVCEDKDALNITYKVTFYNGESLDQFISVVNKMANLKSSREGNYVYFRKEITK